MKPNTGVPISPETGIPGWLTDEEEKQLIRYALEVPPEGVIVEIGSEYGRSAGAFLLSCDPTVKVASVDLFPTDHPVVGDLRVTFESNLVEAGYQDANRVAFRASSEVVAARWKGPIDLLFIDGDHTYEGASRDIKVWSGYVRPKGLMLIHDVANGPKSHPLHFEVLRAVNELVSEDEWTLEHKIDSLRVYRRRPHADKTMEQPLSRAAAEPDERDSDGGTPSAEADASVRVRVRRKRGIS